MCQSVLAGVTRGLGVCVQCVRQRCYTSFHVTCAQYRGLLSEECAGKSGLICHKHYLTQVRWEPGRRGGALAAVVWTLYLLSLQEERKVVEICEGDQVYVEREGEVEAGAVSEVGSQLQYEVSFEDGSICSNLSPTDILVSHPVH